MGINTSTAQKTYTEIEKIDNCIQRNSWHSSSATDKLRMIEHLRALNTPGLKIYMINKLCLHQQYDTSELFFNADDDVFVNVYGLFAGVKKCNIDLKTWVDFASVPHMSEDNKYFINKIFQHIFKNADICTKLDEKQLKTLKHSMECFIKSDINDTKPLSSYRIARTKIFLENFETITSTPIDEYDEIYKELTAKLNYSYVEKILVESGIDTSEIPNVCMYLDYNVKHGAIRVRYLSTTFKILNLIDNHDKPTAILKHLYTQLLLSCPSDRFTKKFVPLCDISWPKTPNTKKRIPNEVIRSPGDEKKGNGKNRSSDEQKLNGKNWKQC